MRQNQSKRNIHAAVFVGMLFDGIINFKFELK